MMRQKTMTILCLICLFGAFSSSAGAGEGTEEQGTLQERFDQLEQDFKDMKSQHQTEMQELKDRMEVREKDDTRKGQPHKSSPVGSYGGIMNPDISVVADVLAQFSDNDTDSNRNKIRVKEVEVALQGYLYPGIRADVIPAIEMEYEDDDVHVEVDLEEAYLTIHQIPYVSEYAPVEIQAGRKYMNFGRLNPIHPHHWAFSDTPLVLANLFGDHPWFDDGVQGSLTISNPWDFFLKTTFGFWNGKQLGHAHGEGEGSEPEHAHGGEEEAHEEAGPVSWNGHVYLSRTVLGIPLCRSADSLLGYSVAWDEGRDTVLHEADLTLTLRFPGTFRNLRWQSGFYTADMGIGDYTRYGGYSFLLTNLTKYWQVGYRYDRSQILDPHDERDEWAASGFLTYFFTHSFYVRGQYRFRNMIDDTGEHNGTIQLVFGLGPHSHRLEN